MQDLPDSAAVRDTARRLLASEEFQFGPDTNTGFMDWIMKKLREFFDALGSLSQSSPALSWLIIAACIIVLALIALHMIVVVRRAIAASRSPGGARAAAARREKASQLLEKARQAAAAGDIPCALTLYLRAAILGLDQRGLQRLTETATAREYLVLLRKHPGERSLLEQLLAHYEPAVFGRRPLGPGPMNDVDTITRRLIGETA